MTEPSTPIAPNAAAEQAAAARFAEATRSASFSLQLGVREVRLLGGSREDRLTTVLTPDLNAAGRLVAKGLALPPTSRTVPPPYCLDGWWANGMRLTWAGLLVRALLHHSRHLVGRGLDCGPSDVIAFLSQAIGTGCGRVRSVRREVWDEEHMIISLQESDGGVSQFAVPASAIRRVG